MQKRKKQKAFALIVCTSVLLLLSTMAVTFTRVAVLQRSVSVSYTDGVTADMHGFGSVDTAIANLIAGFKDNIYYRDYLCFTEDAPTQFNGIDIADDETAAGLNINDLQKTFDNNVNEPSYSTNEVFEGHNISSFMGDSEHMYTLKVFDSTSQININSDLASLPQILSNLAEAIEMKHFGPTDNPSLPPYSFDVDITQIGNIIVASRPNDGVGYRSKDSIIGLSDGQTTISESDFEAIQDFITIYPVRSEMDNGVFFQQVTFRTIGNEDNLETKSVAPININTTAWPVLYALTKGIAMERRRQGEIITIEVTQDEAIRLANAVCERRQQDIFPDFNTFMKMIDGQRNQIFDENTGDKVKMLDANFNPDVSLKKQNGNRLKFQNPNRSDLLYHTINFCFFPGGHFEITSLVQRASSTLGMVISQKYCTTAQIFDVDQYDSQEDFELARRRQNVNQKIAQNSFTAPNNLQLDNFDNSFLKSSDISGFFDPIQFDAVTGFAGLDEAANTDDSSGNYLFRADFNGSVAPNKSTIGLDAALINGELPPELGVFEIKRRNNSLDEVNLAADGFVLKKGDDESLLSFNSFPAPNIANLEEDGNLPALLNGDATDSLGNQGNISDNSGSIMFWFKINDDWGSEEDNSANQFRTVFFSNSTFKKDADGGGHFQVGVQRQIEMRATKPPTSGDDALRKLEIRVTNKFVVQKFEDGEPQEELSAQDKLQLATELNFGTFAVENGKFITFTKQLTIDPEVDGAGIHTQEFYHLGVRWHNGLEMEGFSDSSDAIKVTGQFYSNNGALFQRGLTSSLTDFQISESQTTASPLDFIQEILASIDTDNFAPLGSIEPEEDKAKDEEPDDQGSSSDGQSDGSSSDGQGDGSSDNSNNDQGNNNGQDNGNNGQDNSNNGQDNGNNDQDNDNSQDNNGQDNGNNGQGDDKIKKEERLEIAGNVTSDNKIFIGPPAPIFGEIPDITIDDLRISKNISWMNDPSFLPSRYELSQDPNSDFFAQFDVIVDTPNGASILFVKPEILQVNNATDVEATFSDVLGISNRQLPNLTEFLDKTVEKLTIEVKEDKRGKKKREIQMQLKDASGEDLIDSTFRVRFNNDHEKFTATPGQTLEQSLQDYLAFINEPLNVGSLISEFNVLIPLQQDPGEPVSIKFTFNRQDRNPIFQSPLLDKITFAYFTNLRLLEYRYIGK